MICPNCGFEFDNDPLIPLLEKVERNYGIIKTKTLAAFLPASESTALRILRNLEKRGVVCRKTPKTGYQLSHQH